MLCQRCRGLLVREIFCDLRAETARACPATRCINCGYIEDSVVRSNRLHPLAVRRSVRDGIARKGGVVFIKTHSEEYEPT
jgi:RNase P subunit RPR2